jgi:hypothetical protein
MLLWLAFGFTDSGTALPSGPPTEALDRHPAAQWRLSHGARARAFEAVWGPAAFRWNERTGAPRFVGLAGVPEADADALAADLAALAGVPADELTFTSARATPTANGERVVLRYARRWHGAPVEGDEVAFVSKGGRIGAAWVRLTPIGALPEPRAGEVVVADPLRGYGRLVRIERGATRVRALERDGRVVFAYDPRRFDTVTVTHEAYTVGDPLVTHAARDVQVTDSAGTTEQTADDGSHSLTGGLSITLTGPSLDVRQDGATITHEGTDDIDLVANVDLSWSAASTLHHAHVVWDWLGLRWPTHSWLTGQLRANVDITSSSCNAYYTAGSVNFFAESGSCNATGRIASVLYHEVGHGIHEYILAAGSFAGDVSEGSADYVSATILDDPAVGLGFFSDGSGIRELETDRVYPTDVTGGVHNDGLIWGSFLWNLREQWQDAMGDEAGVEATDLLFLGALEQGPGLTDLAEAVLVADDDDGDWSNGTPHDCELIELLDHHGLGPGALGLLSVEHDPLGPQGSETTGYDLSVRVAQDFTHCTGAATPTVTVWFTEEPAARIPAADSTGFESWTALPLATADGETFAGTLPRLPVPSRYRYFLQITSADGTESTFSHEGLDQGVWSFWIGDRAPLWCDDFETGGAGFVHAPGIPWEAADGILDEWTVGSPAGGGAYDPDMAASGARIVTTALDANYQPNNAEYLFSPGYTFSTAGRMRLLTYQRWLTVEDGRYDHARVGITDGTTVTNIWSNAGTAGGTTPLLDVDWTVTDHELTPFLDLQGRSPGPLYVAFTLQTDGGLEYGGWALDDLCFVELDDPEDHYRRVDLTATWVDNGEADVGTVELTWNSPWIKPLSGLVLVRQADRWPEALDDGVIVDLDLSPVFGEAHQVIDDLPGLDRGTVWYYAVFAWGAGDEDAYVTAVDGQNARSVGFPVRDTGSPPDTGDDTAVTEDSGEAAPPDRDTGDGAQKDCGCTSGGGSGVAFGGGLALAAVARRRRRG